MKRLLTLVVLFLSAAVVGQDTGHAPTAEQCRADITVWKSQSRMDRTALSVETLISRSVHLGDCDHVLLGVKDRGGADWARMIRVAYIQDPSARALHFIKRSGISPRFF